MGEKEDSGCKAYTREQIVGKLKELKLDYIPEENDLYFPDGEKQDGVIVYGRKTGTDNDWYVQVTSTHMQIRKNHYFGEILLPWVEIESAIALFPLITD